MTVRTNLIIVVVAFTCTACLGLQGQAETDVRPAAQSEVLNTNGVWQSDGFGYVMQVENEAVRFFHATNDICVETDNEDLKLADVFEVYRFTDPYTMLMSSTTEPFEFKFSRIADLPAVCTEANDGSIARTAAALVSFLSQHYVFFDERGLERAQFNAEIAKIALAEEDALSFYTALTGILSRTKDAHVELSATIDGEGFRFDADPGLIRRFVSLHAAKNGTTEKEEREAFLQDFWVEGIGEGILNGQSKSAANDRIRYGIVDGNIGYIAVRSMGGFIADDGTDGDTEKAVLSNIMDRAIADFDKVRARAVILDISINSGGYGYLSRQLAGRFFDERRKVYEIYAGDAQDQTPQAIYVEPEGRSQFIGPVYVLTSSETVSAAESLTMAMRARPHVTHAGEATRGALSTKLAKLLPNGWELMLSNQVVLDHEGITWEANAPAPDLLIKIFPNRSIKDNELLRVDFSNAHQSAVAKLLTHVQETLKAD